LVERAIAGNILFNSFRSPLGTVYLFFLGDKLAGIRFGGDTPSCKKGKIQESFARQLSDYFNGRLRKFDFEMAFVTGTDFEHKVWLALKDVPYGQTRTYKWLAEKIGNPKAVRAVGRALGRNPIPIVLPCHRIIESDGSIGGYSSGVDIKRRLLDLEYYNVTEH
jgi:methylated-DNA-[protein]-cysteine S-methyltransferase